MGTLVAAYFYDRCGAGFPAATRRATESYLRGLKGWRFGPAVLHRAFDYLASKV